MSTASSGAARERRVRDHMIDAGWSFIMRAAASKGSADLLMAHPTHGAALVQVGTFKSKHIGPVARTRFLRDASLCSALPIAALVIPGVGIRYHLINPGPASHWTEFTP